MKKGISIGIIALFIVSTVSPMVIGFKSDAVNCDVVIAEMVEPESIVGGNTLYVGGSGSGNYTKIQDAIDDASDGDTIFVYNDSSPYYENIKINKSIHLIGEDKNTTIIDGGGSGDVVFVSANNVNISLFTVQNSGSDLQDAGIEIHSDYNDIYENIIINNTKGIRLYGAIYNNIIKNMIENYECYGVSLVNGADRNIIANNTIRFGYEGIDINLEGGNNNLIFGNVIIHNTFCGIRDSRNANTVIWNTIADNGHETGSQWSSGVHKIHDYSVFHHNDFFFNYRNAWVDNGCDNNSWDDGSKGNYWDDWKSNPGYPDTYIIPGWSVDVDYHPSSTRWSDTLVVDGYGYGHGHGGHGTIYVVVNDSIDFHGRAKGGVSPRSWHWDFGDGNTSDKKDPTHSYNGPGTYKVIVTVIDNASHSDTDIASTVCVGTGPPDAPKITGRKYGRTGKQYKYTFNATDPDGNDVFYYIDWGDGTWYEEVGPCRSGMRINISYKWSEEGNYTIRACARDPTYEYGPWATLEVTMPKNQNLWFLRWLERFPILQRLLSLPVFNRLLLHLGQ